MYLKRVLTMTTLLMGLAVLSFATNAKEPGPLGYNLMDQNRVLKAMYITAMRTMTKISEVGCENYRFVDYRNAMQRRAQEDVLERLCYPGMDDDFDPGLKRKPDF